MVNENIKYKVHRKPRIHFKKKKRRSVNVHAPYNFTPLADFILSPEWAEYVSHDIPFEDGLCGEIPYQIQMHTPMLIGDSNIDQFSKNKDINEVVFFSLPDDKQIPAIPGSSLRGMVRNVLEIAGFGKMQWVDDKRYGVRDLSKGGKFYREQVNNAKSGWLYYDKQDNEWKIRPCRFLRVDQKSQYADGVKGLSHYKIIADKWQNSVAGPRPFKGRSAWKKYDEWSFAKKDLQVSFSIIKRKRNKGGVIDVADMKGNDKTGFLVFTGQPSDKKRYEYIFYDEDDKELISVGDSYRDFIFIHKPGKGDDENSWSFMENKYYPIHQRIPVFYKRINNNDRLVMGLSNMFKVAYRFSTHEFIEHTHKDHLNPGIRDICETIFGKVSDSNQEDSLKSRVSFSLSTPTTAYGKKIEYIRSKHILGSPKASYYPTYIKQQQQNNAYSSYMDENAEIHGWKRYPLQNDENSLNINKQENFENSAVVSELQLLKPGVVFSGKLRFHNLRPFELGAVLWAMTWGNQPRYRHAIGMGKSLGYGQISIHIHDKLSKAIIANNGHKPPTLAMLLNNFTTNMNNICKSIGFASKGWEGSEQIRQLLAMAIPDNPDRQHELKYMRLDHRNNINDYVDAKNDPGRPFLPPYVSTECSYKDNNDDFSGPKGKVLFAVGKIISEEFRNKVVAKEKPNGKKQMLLKNDKIYLINDKLE